MDRFVPIDEVISELEREPLFAERMRAGRKRLAPILYPAGGENYERMMRGEAPKRAEDQLT